MDFLSESLPGRLLPAAAVSRDAVLTRFGISNHVRSCCVIAVTRQQGETETFSTVSDCKKHKKSTRLWTFPQIFIQNSYMGTFPW